MPYNDYSFQYLSLDALQYIYCYPIDNKILTNTLYSYSLLALDCSFDLPKKNKRAPLRLNCHYSGTMPSNVSSFGYGYATIHERALENTCNQVPLANTNATNQQKQISLQQHKDLECPERQIEPENSKVYAELNKNTQDIRQLIQAPLDTLKATVPKSLKSTLHFAILAIIVAVSNGRKDGSLISDSYTHYVRICMYYHCNYCKYRTFQRLFQYGSACSDDVDEIVRKFSTDYNCPLMKYACKLLTSLIEKASTGVLNEGALLVQALNSKMNGGCGGILAVDGSVFNLTNKAAERCIQDQATQDACKGTTGCSRKAHVIFDLVSCAAKIVHLTKGVGNERTVVKNILEQIDPNKILLADAGYVDLSLLRQLTNSKIYFTIRTTKNANPQVKNYQYYNTSPKVVQYLDHISDEYVELKIDWQELELIEKRAFSKEDGVKFKQLPAANDTCLDVDVYTEDGSTLRLIRFYNPCKKRDKSDCDPYIYFYTNLPREQLSPMDIWALYRQRWQIEIFFKATKQYCFMDGWKSERIGTADFFVLMSLVAYHIKLIMAQTVQAHSNEVLSMLSMCDIDEFTMYSYLGICSITPNVQGMLDSISSRAYKKQAQLKQLQKQYAKYGDAVFIYELLLRTAKKSRVSITNKIHLKSTKMVAELIGESTTQLNSC